MVKVTSIKLTGFYETNNIYIIKSCQSYFSFQFLSAVLISKRVAKLNMKFENRQNQLRRMINNLRSY